MTEPTTSGRTAESDKRAEPRQRARPDEPAQRHPGVPNSPAVHPNGPVVLPNGSDLGLARGTDFYDVDEMLSQQELALRDRVRQWCDTQVIPTINSFWEDAELPWPLVDGYRTLGIAGGTLSAHGCPGLSPLAEGMIVAELARADGSIATLNAVHSGLAMAAVGILGDEQQQAQWLPGMATLDTLGAFALTEPDHGSDVVQLDTRARRDGQDYLLTGHKRWIGLGGVADLIVVWARDDDGKVGAFVVEQPGRGQHVSGYHARTITGKTANRAVWQAQLALDDVRVPARHRLARSRSFADTNIVLAKSRQTVAWEALGHAVGAYDAAVTYACRREQFGRPLAGFQLIQDKLSRMLSDITSMQLLCVRMAQLASAGRCSLEHAAMAKLTTASGARRVCATARDIVGGNGILLDHHVARHHADIEAVYTYEGSDTVQSLIVGRAITGLSAFT